MKKVIFTGLFVLSTVCSSFAAEVNLFTSRHYSSDVELYKKFTNNTGIKVNVIKANYKVLEKRLLSEGKSSKAGTIGSKAFSAKVPWPISRLPGPRIGFASPTQNGGKL